MYNCPQCNSPFEKGEKICGACAYNLEQEFLYDPICPVCGTLYLAGTERCKFDDALLIEYKDFTVKCVRCGAVYPPDTKLCPVDGSSVKPKVNKYNSDDTKHNNSQTNGDAQYGYYSEAEGYVYPKASLSSRLIAIIVDYLFIALLSIPATAAILLSIKANDSLGKVGIFIYYFGLLLYIIPLVYAFIKDGLGEGRSWGKKSLDLMVVDIKTNAPCSIGGSMVRNLIAFMPYLGFVDDLILLFNRKGQRLGDMIGRMQVIETWHYAPELNNGAETAKSI